MLKHFKKIILLSVIMILDFTIFAEEFLVNSFNAARYKWAPKKKG